MLVSSPCKSHFGVLCRYRYVITTTTTVITCDHKEKKIWMLCDTPFTFHFATTFTLGIRKKTNSFNKIFYDVHYAMVILKKQNFISALGSRCHDHEKKLFTFSFIKNVLIATTSTTPWLCQKNLFSYSYYVRYAVIMTKIHIFILALRALRLDHDKKMFFISVLRSLGPNHEKILYCFYVHYLRYHDKKYRFSFHDYVHYAVIMTKNIYFYFSTTSPTRWLRKKDILVFWIYIYFRSNTTFTTQ